MNGMTMESPIGTLLLEGDERSVCAVRLLARKEDAPQMDPSPALHEAARQLTAYFAGERRSFDFPVALSGRPFERAVWQALLEIPYGETRTYGELAAQLGCPGGARAVGGACARNPLLIAAACHRVIASNGALTGFAAGMEAKRWLLAHEGHRIDGGRIVRGKSHDGPFSFTDFVV